MTIFEAQVRDDARARLAGLRENGRRKLIEFAASTNADVSTAGGLVAVADLDPESAALVAGLQAAGTCAARVAQALHECPMLDLPALIERLNAALAG